MEKFLIIDGNSIMNRAFYGLSSARMTTKEGIHTNAVFGFLNTYWLMLDKLNPDYVAVSFDLRAPTFRHKLYTDYKGTRKGMPEELKEQMPIIKEVLSAMNIPVLQLETYEADDILGTVSNINTKNNIFTYILTGDRDSYQLISSNTSVVMPSNKNKTDYTIYTPELLKENYHITPMQVIEVKALMGDASDNIPGVKGVGEKTAYSLIEENGNIDTIYENIDSLGLAPKLKEKLIKDKEMAYLSKTLATIDVNVPIELNYNDCKLKNVDTPKLYRLFKNLEFSKFLNKYDFTYEMEQEEKQNNASLVNLEVAKTIIVDDTNIDVHYNNLVELFKKASLSYIFDTNHCKFDSFKSILNFTNKYYLALYSHDENISYIINLDHLSKKDILKEFCASECNKFSYNMKQDLRYFFDLNICDVCHFKFDVMIAYYLMDSNRTNYNIDYILYDLFHYELKINDQKKGDVQLSLFGDVANDIQETEFLSTDDIKNINACLKGIYLSHDIVLEKLKRLNMLELFDMIEMPLVETLASMEHVGMYIDLEKLEAFSKKLTDRMSILEKEIYELAGETFNINSTQQLGVILFEKLNLPTVKKNKTGYSTDKDVLDELSDKHPIISKIIEHRQTMKLYTTFVEGLRITIKDDHRIHTTFMQTVTSTGRLSSVEPNLQNIPVRLELGREVRSFFAGEDTHVIVDADYSQIELRVLAHISHDETMIEAFKNDIDIHKVTASQVFDVPLEEVTPTMRTHAKAVNFGIVYGISDFGLAKNISSTKKEAAMYIDNYLKKYSGIARFMEDVVKEAKINGYVTTLFHRRRYIPELLQKNKMVVQFGERIAMNTPIQGTAADIIKLAMNRIYKELKVNQLQSKLVMQVHDELIIETVPEEVEQVKSIMKKAMENVITLDIPLKVDLNVGKTWYDAK
ncbi:MAG: DNA polymerase I [Clostridia bacterium]|nr:DNA polymerase I [Clostridia bacterium]